jgi:predicted DNA-binding ribbon-helix-helix protein
LRIADAFSSRASGVCRLNSQMLEKYPPIAIVRVVKQSRAMSKKHSVRIAGHLTSVSVEPPFWQALAEIAARRGQSLNALLAAIDRERNGNLSSEIRLFVLDCCRRGELSDAPAGTTC